MQTIFILLCTIFLRNIHAANLVPSVRDNAPAPASATIRSPEVTTFGDWGNWDMCPNGTYVKGVRICSEKPGSGDNTALNAVEFICADINPEQESVNYVSSNEGNWGDWSQEFTCPTDSFVVGFQLRSESYQGLFRDDTACNNIRIICYPNNFIECDGNSWGDWTAVQMCPPAQKVCGIQTQVEKSQGGADDTSLNNVNCACCPSDNFGPPGGTF